MTNIAQRSPTAAISLLCTWNEPVAHRAGEIHPTPQGFELRQPDCKPRFFGTASGAVEVLNRLSNR